MAGRKTSAGTAEWSAIALKQIVQRTSLAPFLFVERFPCHAAHRIAIHGKALLPGVFVGQRRQNLRSYRILLIVRQGSDLFQRLLQQRRHASSVSRSFRHRQAERQLAPGAFAPDIENEPAREIVTRHFEQEAGFVDAVKRGEDAIESGDYLTHEQVGQRLQRFLQVCAGIRRP